MPGLKQRIWKKLGFGVHRTSRTRPHLLSSDSFECVSDVKDYANVVRAEKTQEKKNSDRDRFVEYLLEENQRLHGCLASQKLEIEHLEDDLVDMREVLEKTKESKKRRREGTMEISLEEQKRIEIKLMNMQLQKEQFERKMIEAQRCHKREVNNLRFQIELLNDKLEEKGEEVHRLNNDLRQYKKNMEKARRAIEKLQNPCRKSARKHVNISLVLDETHMSTLSSRSRRTYESQSSRGFISSMSEAPTQQDQAPYQALFSNTSSVNQMTYNGKKAHVKRKKSIDNRSNKPNMYYPPL